MSSQGRSFLANNGSCYNLIRAIVQLTMAHFQKQGIKFAPPGLVCSFSLKDALKKATLVCWVGCVL